MSNPGSEQTEAVRAALAAFADCLADLRATCWMDSHPTLVRYQGCLDAARAALSSPELPAEALTEPVPPGAFNWMQVGPYLVRGGRVVEWDIDNCADERPDGAYALFAAVPQSEPLTDEFVAKIMTRIDEYASSRHVDIVSGIESGVTAEHRKSIKRALEAASQTATPQKR